MTSFAFFKLFLFYFAIGREVKTQYFLIKLKERSKNIEKLENTRALKLVVSRKWKGNI